MTDERATGALLAAAVDGDEAAWRELVDRTEGAIWGATTRLGLTQAQAEDVFQTVWLRLIDRHETIKNPERLAGWLKTVAHNEGLAILRRQGRERASDAVDLLQNPVDGPELDLTRLANSELLMEGFAKLSEPCREVLYLIATKVPYRHIAQRMNIAVGTIGSMRKRCLNVLASFAEVKQAMEPAS